MRHASGPLRVLIVEDEALLAMDIKTMIEDSGHLVVGEGASLHDTISLGDIRPDLALVDLHLAFGDSGLEVCAYIRNRWAATIVVFVTANPNKIPDDFGGGHGVIPKPFTRAGLTSAVRYIAQGVSDPPPNIALPTSFTASPSLIATWRQS